MNCLLIEFLTVGVLENFIYLVGKIERRIDINEVIGSF